MSDLGTHKLMETRAMTEPKPKEEKSDVFHSAVKIEPGPDGPIHTCGKCGAVYRPMIEGMLGCTVMPKPNALDMLALYKKDAEAFWLEVRHEQRQYCTRCGKSFFRNPARMYVSDWPVPPPLDCSPEELAVRLRDRVTQLEKELMPPEPRMFNAAARVLCGKTTVEDGEESVVWSCLYYATPYEQIAVALVALGHWNIGEK